MASSAAIVIAALVVVAFEFKSIAATVVVAAFVVAFDEPIDDAFWFSRSDSSSFLLLDDRIAFFATRDAAPSLQNLTPLTMEVLLRSVPFRSLLPMQWLVFRRSTSFVQTDASCLMLGGDWRRMDLRSTRCGSIRWMDLFFF